MEFSDFFIIFCMILVGAAFLVLGFGLIEEKQEQVKPLNEMSCFELVNELGNKPYGLVQDNELYKSNLLKAIELKNCDLNQITIKLRGDKE